MSLRAWINKLRYRKLMFHGKEKLQRKSALERDSELSTYGLLLACTILALLICAMIAVLTADQGEPTTNLTTEATDISVEEYGNPSLITSNEDPLRAYIRFPQAGGFADSVIMSWANKTYADAEETIKVLRETDGSAQGEINIQSQSYTLGKKYASIVEQGMFSSTGLAHPTDVIRTFNLDVEHNVFLENSDILDMSKKENILSIIKSKILASAPDAGDYFADAAIDEWLNHLALDREGITVILERGVCLPAYLGSLRIELPYDELGDMLLLDKGAMTAASSHTTEPLQQTEPADAAATNIPSKASDIDPSKPMIALTFDDGPSKYTSRILDLLAQHKGRATFCVLGNLVESRPDIVKRAISLGNEVIGHSWDHRDLTKLTPEEIEEEILGTYNAIKSLGGTAKKMYRPPYGAVDDTLKEASAELGFSIIYWSLDTIDWKAESSADVYNAVMNDAEDKAIILCHDIYSETADAMESVIVELIDKGYQLVTVSELLENSGKSLEAGEVYFDGR